MSAPPAEAILWLVGAVAVVLLGAFGKLIVTKIDKVFSSQTRMEEQMSGRRGVLDRLEELGERSHKHAQILQDHEGRLESLEGKR